MKIFENLFKDGNSINEGNIVVFVALILLIFDEVLGQIRGLTWIDIASFGIHMVFVFLVVKTEHSKLNAKDVLKTTTEILNKK